MKAIQGAGNCGYHGAMGTMLYVLAYCGVIGCFVCWFISITNAIRMTRNRKPDVPHPLNLYNIASRPWQLTEVGLKARRRMIFGSVGILVCMAMTAAALSLRDRLK